MSIFEHFAVQARTLLFLVVSGVALSGLSTSVLSQAATRPAPSVEVERIELREIRRWTTFSGRLTPVESVIIKPRVGGAIREVLFNEGELVKEGQPLFVIDPRPYEAVSKRAEGQLATAQAHARLSADELKRSSQLVKDKLVSVSIYEGAVAANEVSQAEILQAEGVLGEARLNLEYAHITAPISGRVGRAELTVGNIVDAGVNAPILTSIVASDQLYAEFRVDEQTYLEMMRGEDHSTKMPVQLLLADDKESSYRGYLHAFDNHLDSASGTIRARAIFDNKDGILTAGMFANIQLGSSNTQLSLLVPERAIGTNQDKKYLYVIDKNNTVQYRNVVLGQQHQGQRIILSGLTGGERVAVNSLSHLRPNIEVNPVDVSVSTSEQVAAH